ncbi:hypothetical protein DSO57_1022619 [Entomophthora muscae]|uniref:Uncharacterized protein n=1 Tax=Entomophthora muscae TaxID=34485 RepID=A0ACC2RU25_9FUNG|nr:hypothetical protein DSO57_1022619 [Entomophthora muscae]
MQERYNFLGVELSQLKKDILAKLFNDFDSGHTLMLSEEKQEHQIALSSLPSNKTPPIHTIIANPFSSKKDEAALTSEQLAHVCFLGPKVVIMDFELAHFRALEVIFNVFLNICFFNLR